MRNTYYLLLFLFLISSAAVGQVGNYRSLGSGAWGTAGTWERDADSNGSFEESPSTVAPNTPGTAGTITIQNGHDVNVAASVSIDQTTVQSGGVLTVDATFVVTLNNGTGTEITIDAGGALTLNGTLAFGGIPNKTVLVNGTLNNNGITSGTAAAKLTFGSGSNYFHQFADGGTIPAATWNSNSTVNIVGYTSGNSTAPSGLGQTFGHFVWNAPGQDVTISLGGLPTAINGDFRVEDTGSDALFYSLSGAGNIMNVGGDFDINGGVLGWTSGDADVSMLNVIGDIDISGNSYVQLADDQNLTINLTGNFILSGSAQLDFSATTATTNLNIQGNYTFSGGDIFMNGTGNVNFTGASGKVFTSTLTPTGSVNYSVAGLSTLSVAGSNFVGGGGTFTLNGTLLLGSPDSGGALQTGTSNGNIRVAGTRTYASNSTISYNGTLAQFIGNGFPTSGVVNLTINNSSNVTLSTSLDIVALSVLTLTSGNLVIGSQTLTVNGTISGSGGIVGGATSNLTIGGTGNFGTLNFAGTNQLLNFTLNRSSSGLVALGGDLTIIGTFTQTAGDISLNGNDLTIAGNFNRSAGNIVVHNSSTLVVDGSGTMPSIVGLSGTTLNTLTLDRSGATLTSGASITVNNLNLLDGTFANGAGFAISSGGTITRNAGSMSTSPTSSGTYNILYNVSGTISSGFEFSSVDTRIQNVTMDGGGIVNLTASRTINGNLTLTSGDFNIGSNSVTLKGNLIANSSSTLTSGTILFDGVTTISGSAIPTFGNIQVNDTRTLTFPAGSFDVAGNILFDAGAIVNSGSGTLRLTGASNPQTFSGGGVTMGNVTIDKTSGADVDLTSQLIITGALEVISTNSDFGSNGNLTLRSTTDGVTNNGRIGQLLNGATVSGDVIVERFMAAEGRIYRYISSPVSGFTVAQLQSEFPITGSFTGTSVCGTCLTNQSMFSYDGATQLYVDFPSTVNSEVLLPGVGYSTFVRQDVIGGAATIDWAGPINFGTVALPVSHNGTGSSWNLVGNPYPSTIDWDNAGWTKTNISGSISVRDNSTGIFQSWNGATGGLTGGRIATGQGFWVRTTAGSPVLQVTEPVKSSTTGAFFRKAEDEELNQFVLTLSDGVVEDNAYYWISDVAANDLDDFDAVKLNNFRNTGNIPLMDLGTYSYGESSVAMAINAIGQLNCSDTVRVYTNDLSIGNYSMKFNASGFVNNLTWILRDKFLNSQVNVSQNPEYQFVVNAEANSNAVERFELVLEYTPVDISMSGNTLISSQETGNQWYLNGVLLEGETNQELNASESGLYTLTTNTGACITSADVQFVITGEEEPLRNLVQTYPNPFNDKFRVDITSTLPVSIRIYNMLGLMIEERLLDGQETNKSAEFNFSGNADGLYIVHIQRNGKTHQIKVIKNKE